MFLKCKLLVISKMFINSNCSELCPILVDQLVNIITEKANGGHTVGEAKNGGVYLVEGKIGGV